MANVAAFWIERHVRFKPVAAHLVKDSCGRMDRLRQSFPARQGAQVRNDGARVIVHICFFVVHEAFDNALVQRDAVYFPKEY